MVAVGPTVPHILQGKILAPAGKAPALIKQTLCHRPRAVLAEHLPFADINIVELLDVKCSVSAAYSSHFGSFHPARVVLTSIRQNITPRGGPTNISRPSHHGRRPAARAVHQGQG